MNLDSINARETWESYTIEIALTGSTRQKTPDEPLTASPEALDFGTTPKGEEQRGRIELRTGRQPIDIESMVWKQPEGEAKIEDLTCEERVAPHDDEEDAQCIIEIVWNGDQQIGNTLVIAWRYDSMHTSRRRNILEIPVHGHTDQGKGTTPRGRYGSVPTVNRSNSAPGRRATPRRSTNVWW